MTAQSGNQDSIYDNNSGISQTASKLTKVTTNPGEKSGTLQHLPRGN